MRFTLVLFLAMMALGILLGFQKVPITDPVTAQTVEHDQE
jgi:hypothetical protein